MDSITLQELRALVEHGPGPRISLYVKQQPVHAQAHENTMQLRHALFEAATNLTSNGYDKTRVDSVLQPGVDLLRDGKLGQASGGRGLALLFAPGVFRWWQLPFEGESTVDVGAEFRIAPLVRLLNWAQETRVLALSETNVRLLRCTRDVIQKLNLPSETPACLDAFEGGPDVGRAVRFQTSAGPTGAKNLIHGQASFKDEEDTRLHAYVRTIARNVGKMSSREDSSLLLIAAEELHPIFNDAYPAAEDLLPGIHASPAHLSDTEIQRQVVEAVDRYGNRELRAARDHFRSALEQHRATSLLEDIVPAAIDGRVDTLIVAFDERAWGFWDDPNRCVTACAAVQAGCVDLIELAIRETLRHNGRVCVVPRSDVPDQARSVAALRW